MDASHAKFLFPYKLVTGINVSIGGDSHILAAGSTAPQPLDDAGALGQVYIEMEEIDIFPIDQSPGQFFVFLFYPVQVLLPDGEGIVGWSAAGFHRYVTKAQVTHVQYIGGEV